jgi:hypothetical protein
MGQAVGVEAFCIYLSCLEVPYEALLLVYVQEILYVGKTGLGLETVNTSWNIQAQDHASHIKHYCLCHN